MFDEIKQETISPILTDQTLWGEGAYYRDEDEHHHLIDSFGQRIVSPARMKLRSANKNRPLDGSELFDTTPRTCSAGNDCSSSAVTDESSSLAAPCSTREPYYYCYCFSMHQSVGRMKNGINARSLFFLSYKFHYTLANTR
jgi:hypothetical protein